MEYRRFQSSNIRDIGYDPSTLEMRVIFNDGREYAYKDVPPSTHRAFINAQSKGGHFHAHIRPHFKGELVEDE